MAVIKEIKARVKLQIQGGAATPAPPVGSSLGQHQVNIMEFCKLFNAQTANRKGETVPVEITIYKDKTFSMVLKTPPASELIKKRAKVAKGSSRPEEIVGRITRHDVEEIAKAKMPDLNAHQLEQAMKTIAGTARSMGIEVVD
jgi:large subunit ribosomal protein L11